MFLWFDGHVSLITYNNDKTKRIDLMNIRVSVSCNGGKNIFEARLERMPGAVICYPARFTNTTGEVLKLDHFGFTGLGLD